MSEIIKNEKYKKYKKSYPGINIQWPISELILSGEKTIETRTYPLPKKYLNKEMILIETPGPDGNFIARNRAIIKFTDCFLYKSEAEFYNDYDSHLVDKGSPWAWTTNKPKWGWKVVLKQAIKVQPALQKGIVFTKSISI